MKQKRLTTIPLSLSPYSVMTIIGYIILRHSLDLSYRRLNSSYFRGPFIYLHIRCNWEGVGYRMDQKSEKKKDPISLYGVLIAFILHACTDMRYMTGWFTSIDPSLQFLQSYMYSRFSKVRYLICSHITCNNRTTSSSTPIILGFSLQHVLLMLRLVNHYFLMLQLHCLLLLHTPSMALSFQMEGGHLLRDQRL